MTIPLQRFTYPFPGNGFSYTGTITVTLQISLHYSTHKIFKSHVKSSEADFLYSSALLVLIRSELTVHDSCYTAAEWTWTYSKHISCDRYPASLLACRLDLQKTQLLLLLHVGPSLESCYLAMRWPIPLQYNWSCCQGLLFSNIRSMNTKTNVNCSRKKLQKKNLNQSRLDLNRICLVLFM
jgi:hypothetical protein